MLPGCGKKHTDLSAGSPFEVQLTVLLNKGKRLMQVI